MKNNTNQKQGAEETTAKKNIEIIESIINHSGPKEQIDINKTYDDAIENYLINKVSSQTINRYVELYEQYMLDIPQSIMNKYIQVGLIKGQTTKETEETNESDYDINKEYLSKTKELLKTKRDIAQINQNFKSAVNSYTQNKMTKEIFNEYIELIQQNSDCVIGDIYDLYFDYIPHKETIYKYNENNILHRAKEIIELHIDCNKDNLKQAYKDAVNEINDQYYIIRPNPFYKKFFLVYQDKNKNKQVQYMIYNKSHTIKTILKQQYKQFDKGFKQEIRFKDFLKQIDIDEEEETSNKDILLNDGFTYNFHSRMFLKENNNIPCFSDETDFSSLTTEETKILNKFFNIMYNEKEFKQYLYYILCCMNKNYAKQSLFLVIDRSGSGKTARISPFAEIGLIDIADSNLLKKTELYNIISTNCFVINEFQDNKGGSGGSINNLVDSTPLKVTRKSEGAIKIKGKDKPLLTIMGESLPFIEEMSKGTNRRMLLVPKMSEEFKDLKDTTKDLKQFYDILYNKSTAVIQYYNDKIDEYNIEKEYKDIKKQMTVTLQDLQELTEDRTQTLGKYFELEPQSADDPEFIEAYILEKGKSLDILLEYIEQNCISTRQIVNPQQRRTNLFNIIKKINGVKNIKNFGYKNKQHALDDKKNSKKTFTYYYGLSLTSAGHQLVRKINENAEKGETILYMKKYNEKKSDGNKNYILEYSEDIIGQTKLL